MKIRRPRRDMNRPQARHGRLDWEMRWRSIWGRQRAAAKGLTGVAALNEHIKAVYSDAMPPGSPGQTRHGLSSLVPSGGPLMRLLGLS